MRAWWRDKELNAFWRDIGVIVIALAVFTVPLLIVSNIVSGGWIAQADKIQKESGTLIKSIEKYADSLERISEMNKQQRDYHFLQSKKFENQYNNISGQINDLRDKLESICEYSRP
jgi:hypothetical protein